MKMLRLLILSLAFSKFAAISLLSEDMVVDYFAYKDVRQLCYFACEPTKSIRQLVQRLINLNIRTTIATKVKNLNLNRFLERKLPSGVLIDAGCEKSQWIMEQSSQSKLLDKTHSWLVVAESTSHSSSGWIRSTFLNLNLSADTDVVVALFNDNGFDLWDVFSFGSIQGNDMEINRFGRWNNETGLKVLMTRYKYYYRWDFHNLTMRAVTVMSDFPREPEDLSILTEQSYSSRVPVLTKPATMIIDLVKQTHNFRFNYTFVEKWVGVPKRNSTPAVTNLLFWGEQDIAATSARIFSEWFQWTDPFTTPVYTLQTKFYYLIPETGPGEYENRFLTPLSPGAWGCAFIAAVCCAVLLGFAVSLEARPQPTQFAFFTVFAAACQQCYTDGVRLMENTFKSQAFLLMQFVLERPVAVTDGQTETLEAIWFRWLPLGVQLVVVTTGVMTMLLYNYYTSSVVSWLLSAAPPTIRNLEGLINSDLEVVFQDIGYNRGWLNDAHFFYFVGYVNPVEDQLRDKIFKTKLKRKAPLLTTVQDGFSFVRKGGFAFQGEAYSAGHEISRTFDNVEICKLGELPMLRNPHKSYVLTQKRSPYKEFFDWSFMRLIERGHFSVIHNRLGGKVPACRGQTPRALSLGQAAPALLVLLAGAVLALCVMIAEILYYSYQRKKIVKNERTASLSHASTAMYQYLE